MPNSPLLGIPQVAPNQNNKETTINDGFAIIERSLNDQLVVSLAAGNVTVLATDFQRHQVMKCQGHTVARTLTVPNQKRFFAVQNSGTGIITVRTATLGTSVDVPVGSYVIIYLDGANNCTKIADSANATLTPTFTALTDTPSSYTGEAGNLVRVNSGETALEFFTLTLDLTDLDDIPAPTADFFLKRKADDTGYEWVSSVGGLADEFIELNDVPVSYTGAEDQVVTVNGTADGLVFTPRNALLAFTDLTDAPDTFSGESNKLVSVNASGTALEFVNPPTVGTPVTAFATDANLGFENLLFGWSVTVGDSADIEVVTDVDGFMPYEGTQLAYVDTDTNTSLAIERVYDLTVDLTNAQLDNNARITYEWAWARLLDTTSTGSVTLETLSATDVVLSTLTVTGLAGTLADWQTDQRTVNLPLGTRKLRVTLETSNTVPGMGWAWDLTRLSLTTLEPLSFTDLLDVPSAYTGEAGKVARVNSGENALEFSDFSFLALDQTPDDFAGQAGMALVVNVTETGLEFGTVSGAVPIEDEGTEILAAPSAINFVGAGVTVTDEDGVATVTIPGALSVAVEDEGSTVLTAAARLNFVGAGVTATDAGGGEITVTIPGASLPPLTINSQASDYTLVLGDAGAYIRMTSASANELEVPENSSVAFPVGTVIQVRQAGAGQTSIVAAAGVTINTAETLLLRKQGSTAALIKVGTNSWDLTGDLELL